jgi:hypothetical protein
MVILETLPAWTFALRRNLKIYFSGKWLPVIVKLTEESSCK